MGRPRMSTVVLVLLLLAPIFTYASMIAEPGVYLWPQVSPCMSCGGTIWAWQDCERRSYPVGVIGKESLPPGVLDVLATGSGLFHKACGGMPQRNVLVVFEVRDGIAALLVKKDCLLVKESVSLKVITINNEHAAPQAKPLKV